MRKPAITLGGVLLAIWGAVQVYTALAGAYADGADFNKYVADLVRRAMSSLSIGVIVLLTGVGLVLFGMFGDGIRGLLWRKRRKPEGAAPATSQERAAKEAHATQGTSPAKAESQPPLPSAVPSQFPLGIYVGVMNVDAQHLGQEFYLDIAIQGFNATGETISIDDALGIIAYREVVDGQRSDKIDLPPAMILHDRGTSRAIGNMSEMFIIVNQRLPREIAERASDLLAQGHRIELDFLGWNVIARVVMAQERSARLPLWNGAVLGRYPERVITGKSTVGSAHGSIGSARL